jgi:hypothetical protein
MGLMRGRDRGRGRRSLWQMDFGRDVFKFGIAL